MKKFLSFIPGILILALFVTIMLSGNYLKKPRDPSEDVVSFVNIAIDHINNNNWQEAEKDIGNLEKAWDKVLPRIQFSVEKDEILNINTLISRLNGSLMSKHKPSALMSLYEVLENWKELTY